MGTAARAAPAIIRPKSLDISLNLLAIPREIVFASFCVNITNCNGYSFQELMKVKIASAPNPGLIIGNAISMKVRNS